jgi:hypothetical protein
LLTVGMHTPADMPRILAQHGNVIAADFRPNTSHDLTIKIKSEILYHDRAVMLTRTTATFEGNQFMTVHFLGDLATGRIVQLNNG